MVGQNAAMTIASAARLVMFTVLFLAACDSTVEPGVGTLAEVTATTGSQPSGGEPTDTSEPTDATTDSTTSTSPSEGSDDEAALAEAAGDDFAEAINTGDLAAAFELLCPVEREDLTLEEFSDGAPEPGTLTFEFGDQIEPGVYSATISYEGEQDEIRLQDAGTDSYCLTAADA